MTSSIIHLSFPDAQEKYNEDVWERVLAWHRNVQPKPTRTACSGWNLDRFHQEETKIQGFIAQCLGRCPSDNGYWELSVTWWEIHLHWIKLYHSELEDSFSNPPAPNKEEDENDGYLVNPKVVRKRKMAPASLPFAPPRKRVLAPSDFSTPPPSPSDVTFSVKEEDGEKEKEKEN